MPIIAKTLEEMIHKAVHDRAQEIANEESKLAAERVKKRLDDCVAQIAVNVARKMDIGLGSEIRISIKQNGC